MLSALLLLYHLSVQECHDPYQAFKMQSLARTRSGFIRRVNLVQEKNECYGEKLLT
jgi:hypothetical protein